MTLLWNQSIVKIQYDCITSACIGNVLVRKWKNNRLRKNDVVKIYTAFITTLVSIKKTKRKKRKEEKNVVVTSLQQICNVSLTLVQPCCFFVCLLRTKQSDKHNVRDINEIFKFYQGNFKSVYAVILLLRAAPHLKPVYKPWRHLAQSFAHRFWSVRIYKSRKIISEIMFYISSVILNC